MNYTKPSYYDSFKCIAGDCTDTCCAGWEIVIDDETMEHYKKMTDVNGRYIMSNVDEKEGVYKRCNNRCAFLDDNNLCQLIIRTGEENLCKTCDRYPRHFEEYGNLEEALISISCPIASKIIIDRKETDSFVCSTDNKKPATKDVDKKLLNCLLDIRKEIYDILADRSESMSTRIKKVLAIGEWIQPYIYRFERIGKNKLVKKISDMLLNKEWITGYREFQDNSKYIKHHKMIMYEYMKMYTGLENINDKWPQMIESVMQTLYVDLSEEEYIRLKKEFDMYMKDREFEYEHMMVYFIYAYFLGAVYDCNIQGMIKFSVVSTLIIKEMGFAHWITHDKKLSVDEQVTYSYLYSRQVEHSDNNVLCLEGIFTAHPCFNIENLYVVS